MKGIKCLFGRVGGPLPLNQWSPSAKRAGSVLSNDAAGAAKKLLTKRLADKDPLLTVSKDLEVINGLKNEGLSCEVTGRGNGSTGGKWVGMVKGAGKKPLPICGESIQGSMVSGRKALDLMIPAEDMFVRRATTSCGGSKQREPKIEEKCKRKCPIPCCPKASWDCPLKCDVCPPVPPPPPQPTCCPRYRGPPPCCPPQACPPPICPAHKCPPPCPCPRPPCTPCWPKCPSCPPPRPPLKCAPMPPCIPPKCPVDCCPDPRCPPPCPPPAPPPPCYPFFPPCRPPCPPPPCLTPPQVKTKLPIREAEPCCPPPKDKDCPPVCCPPKKCIPPTPPPCP